MDLAQDLADALRRIRREAGLTQTEMARRLGVSQPTLNRLENAEQNATLKTLGRLCVALKCGVGDLFAGRAVARRRAPTGTETRRRAQKRTGGR
jgi:transcriptional regulator with XRE-family HTH domain